jgi:hypothetical protein
MSGLGLLLQRRSRIRLQWVHLLWSLNLFLYTALNWWILYRWQSRSEWTLFLFLFLLLSPTVGYLLSVLLFPDHLDEGASLKEHYYQNHRWFFTLGALLPLIDLADTALKGREHLLRQGAIYLFTISLLFVLMVVAAWTRRERYHQAFAIFFLVYLVAFISINLLVIA